MARRSDHTREELKEIILENAWKIINKHGQEGLTARNLASQLGYAPGTIYNLFASMDELILTLNSKTMDLLLDHITDESLYSNQNSTAHNLKQMAKSYIAFSDDFQPYWIMLFSQNLPESRKTLKWYKSKLDQLFVPLENLLEPHFKSNIKKRQASRILWSSVHGICLLQHSGKLALIDQDGSAENMACQLIDTFVNGLEYKANRRD